MSGEPLGCRVRTVVGPKEGAADPLSSETTSLQRLARVGRQFGQRLRPVLLRIYEG